MEENSKYKFGWQKDLPDFRDHQFGLSYAPASLPQAVDLTPKMPKVYDQGDLGSCHDDQTEVLTDKGWKYFYDITMEDRLASVDLDTKKLIFEYPTRIICLPYEGYLHYGQHRGLDFAVTPDHKMVLRKWNQAGKQLEENYSFVEAKNIGWYCGLLTEIEYEGDGYQSDIFIIKGVEHDNYGHKNWEGGKDIEVSIFDWLKFLGFYIAEGTMIKRSSRDHYKIQLAACTEKKKNFIREVLNRLGIKALELEDRFTFSHKRIYMAMSEMGLEGVHSPYKFVPAMIFKCNKNQINEFLIGHAYGDGSWDNDDIVVHYTSSIRLANDLQLLNFLSGKSSSLLTLKEEGYESTTKDGRIIKANFNAYGVFVSKTNRLSIERKDHIHLKYYIGDVYCAEVPSFHTLVTRRNNKILISGNCTAQAIAAACEYEWLQHKRGVDFIPSRLFIYYNERWLENTIPYDSGASLRDGMKAINKWGFCKEQLWPYMVPKFAVKPSDQAYRDGATKRVYQYSRVPQVRNTLCGALAAAQPITFGIAVYESFLKDNVENTGVVPMPSVNERFLGGHAILLVGYNNSVQSYIFRNSYGEGWGAKGYGLLPFSYVENPDLAGDFWAIKAV